MVSQVDLLSSFAALANSNIQGQDSKDLMDVFLGKSDKGRDELILEATSRTALRKGDWILIPPYNGPAMNNFVNIELGNAKEYQLYNLKEDIGQQHNLATMQSKKFKEMISAYEKIRGESNIKTEQLELK
jgi:hypothetical protein